MTMRILTLTLTLTLGALLCVPCPGFTPRPRPQVANTYHGPPWGESPGTGGGGVGCTERAFTSSTSLTTRGGVAVCGGRRGARGGASLPEEKLHAPRQIRGDIRSKHGGSKPRRRSNQGKALEQGMVNPSRLHVMGGKAKGRRLDSPDVQLRPMMGKVKEALFSTLTGFGVFDRGNARVCDLFSGSGSVGIEALSRGAEFAVFVDLAAQVSQDVDACCYPGVPTRTQARALKQVPVCVLVCSVC